MHLPGGTTASRLEVARYYVSVRSFPDMCGDFTVQIRNLTQHEFHAAVGTSA